MSDLSMEKKLDLILKGIRDLTKAVRDLTNAYRMGVVEPYLIAKSELEAMTVGLREGVKDVRKEFTKRIAPILEEYQQNVVTIRLLRGMWKGGDLLNWVLKKWGAVKYEPEA